RLAGAGPVARVRVVAVRVRRTPASVTGRLGRAGGHARSAHVARAVVPVRRAGGPVRLVVRLARAGPVARVRVVAVRVRRTPAGVPRWLGWMRAHARSAHVPRAVVPVRRAGGPVRLMVRLARARPVARVRVVAVRVRRTPANVTG